MRLTSKELGRILGVHAHKASQSWRPAIRKFSMVLRERPVEAVCELAEELLRLEREADEAWTEAETQRRELKRSAVQYKGQTIESNRGSARRGSARPARSSRGSSELGSTRQC